MKKPGFIVILLLAAFILSTPTFATQNPTVTVSVSNEAIQCGETITVTVSSTSIENCSAGGFLFEFDKSVFDYVSGKALVSNFSAAGISTANDKIAGYFMGGEHTIQGDLFQITLKARTDAKEGNYTISGTANIVIKANDNQNISCSVESATVTVSHNYGDWYELDESLKQRVCSTCSNIETDYIDYTIQFLDWDGTILSENTYHWGQKVTAPASPTRPSDNTFSYSFTGWDNIVENCKGNATYTAAYSKTYIEYTVIFEDWNHEIISYGTYHWGDFIVVPASPTRPADNIYTYTFSGWGNDNVNCEGNATYTAQYTPTYIDYTVTFKDWDGTILSTGTYHWGDAVTPPADPSRPTDGTYSYAFNGWDKEVTSCQGDTTYTATYTKRDSDFLYTVQDKKVTITGYTGNDTQLIIPKKIGSYSVIAIADEAFSGYANLTSIQLPDSVTAIGWAAFENCANLAAISIPKGVTAISGYTFSGCTSLASISIPDSVNAIGVSAFEGCTSLESITVPNGITCIDSSVFSGCTNLKSITVPNSVTSIRDNAFANCNALTTVIYCGTEEDWSSVDIGNGNEVLSNITLQSHHYESGVCIVCGHYEDYTITFLNWDGIVLSSEIYHYGDKVIEPEAPTKDADKTYTYTFNGWDKKVTKCTGNATYTAVYKETYIKYTVIFQNWNGVALSCETYHYDDPIKVPSDPKKEADNTYTYTFSGWDTPVIDCVGDATYTATYTANYIDYTIIFKDWNGTKLSSKTYHYGQKVEEPTPPTRDADKTYTYTFQGWDKTVVDCDGNATYTATYQKTYIEYTIIFKNWDGEILSSTLYHYGDKVTAPADPTRVSNETYNYTFQKWDKSVVTCKGDATYTAVYKKSYINYTVTFLNWNGDILSQKTYHYGNKVTTPKKPSKPADDEYAYTFAGWDKEVTVCTGDATYTAVFTRRPHHELGDVNGDDTISEDDAVYLLLYTMFGAEFYPIERPSADINSSGTVDTDDTIYLLLHILYGNELYPLKPAKIEQ